MKLQLIASAALLSIAGSAFATTNVNYIDGPSFDAGANPEFYDVNVNALPVAGAFENIFTFHVSPAGDATASGSYTKLLKPRTTTTLFNIGNFTIDLYKETGAIDWKIGSVSGNGAELNSMDFTAGNTWLNSGDYYFKVSGTTLGSKSGSYNFKMAVAPVPEPETYALMLAGLGAIGFVARRRKAA